MYLLDEWLLSLIIYIPLTLLFSRPIDWKTCGRFKATGPLLLAAWYISANAPSVMTLDRLIFFTFTMIAGGNVSWSSASRNRSCRSHLRLVTSVAFWPSESESGWYRFGYWPKNWRRKEKNASSSSIFLKCCLSLSVLLSTDGLPYLVQEPRVKVEVRCQALECHVDEIETYILDFFEVSHNLLLSHLFGFRPRSCE